MLRRARPYFMVMLAIPAVLVASADQDGPPGAVPESAAPSPFVMDLPRDIDLADIVLARSAAAPAVTAAPTFEATPSAAPTEAPTPDPATPAPRTAPPVVVAATPRPPAPTQAPATCPSTWFCYPRLGVAGAIVPYTDCAGGTDVGTSIRAFTCLSPNYLMGHAYTQMGKITGWAAGDVVFAYGQAFTVYSAVVEQSCQPPLMPLAPLSMQTSLSSNTCGPVLVVQAR